MAVMAVCISTIVKVRMDWGRVVVKVGLCLLLARLPMEVEGGGMCKLGTVLVVILVTVMRQGDRPMALLG